MAHRRQIPPLPDALDTPDVGFVAASGVYVASVLLAAFITVAAATGATAATILGGVTSTVTGGLIVGALLASRSEGLPERLGRRWRSLAVPFAAPVGFGALSLVSFLSPFSAAVAGAAAGGSVLTGIAAAGIASIARTRYARAIAPGDPIRTITRLDPNQGHWPIVFGTLCLVGAGMSTLSGNGTGFVLLFTGLWSLLVGVSARAQNRHFSKDEQPERKKSRPRGRKIFGTRWGADSFDDTQYLPELHIHENGVVTEQQNSRRFVPWALVTDVRLTPEELIIERRRGFDLRCDRTVIEDAEEAYGEIERTRRDRSETRSEDKAERPSAETDLGQARTEPEVE